MTSSPMFVAWSAIRSRWRPTRMRSTAREIVAGVLHHVGQELPEDLVVELVHLVVPLADVPGQRRRRR